MSNAFIEDLLEKMSLEEKVAQLIQIPYSVVEREEALEWARKGAGSFLHVLGDDAREIQLTALNSAKGIPVLFGIDAIHGHGLNENATIFPSQLAVSCSFNTDLVRKMGRITAREVASDGLHWTFSPVLCLARDTRWGRVNETFGEDPYLTGELGAAIIEGYQGDGIAKEDSILACAKHFIGYGEALGGRDACDTQMTYRKLRDVFLPPFKKAVDAGCATFMTAYGSIDGEPFNVSKKTLTEILRQELGFKGFVVTDWDNVNSLIMNQHVAGDIKEATRMSLEAGNDMIMTSKEAYEAAIELVKSGKLSEEVIDTAVRHILLIKYQMGLFKQPEKKGVPGCIGCENHLKVNKEIAEECVVLLENNGVLPIVNSVKSIAVIGPNADDIKAQYGDWTYFTHPTPDKSRTPIRPYTTVLEGIKEEAGEEVKVTYSKGCGVLHEDTDDINAAVDVAMSSDMVVLVLGDEISQFGEYKDRANLELSGKQLELFKKLKETSKPIITVLVSSKPLCITEVAENSDALIVAFNGGMFGGRAVAKTLFGKINPSAKLSISFPRHSGQIPVYYNSLPGWHGDKYMDIDADPLYSFGQGLSYTTFRYSNLHFEEESLQLSVDVTNSGLIDGYEIAQVYFRDLVSSVMTPIKKLIKFKKEWIPAGKKKTITFKLEREDFSLVNREEKRVLEPGDFLLMVGASSLDKDLLTKRITL